MGYCHTHRSYKPMLPDNRPFSSGLYTLSSDASTLPGFTDGVHSYKRAIYTGKNYHLWHGSKTIFLHYSGLKTKQKA